MVSVDLKKGYLDVTKVNFLEICLILLKIIWPYVTKKATVSAPVVPIFICLVDW
jgi:hypothetical protein